MRDQRHWVTRLPTRFLGELVVLVLLLVAVASLRFDLGDRVLGPYADPTGEPAAVAPPAGLKLPATAAVPALASPSRETRVDAARVARAVRPLLKKGVLGPHFGMVVTDLATGTAVYRSGASVVTPASTTKLLTSTAALETLGPMARFTTTVRYDASSRQVVLVGGGDPFLASSPRTAAATYPRRADVTTLAREAAVVLRKQGVRSVTLGYDDSLFSGPSVNPAWPATYIPESVVPPITALWVDEGHQTTDPTSGFVGDPSLRAAQVFKAALRAAGLRVAGPPRRTTTSPSATDVARVSSPPLGEIVERTLAVSDNEAAEVLARHVGLSERQQGSFLAGAASVMSVVRELGVPMTGDHLYDGSGLSRKGRLSTTTLAAVVRLAASAEHPELRHVLTGLPVAGFTGSLQYRFNGGPAEARGRVRAKTGTLTGVHALAGVADDPSGARMAFAIVADRVAYDQNLAAQTLIDRIAGALGACRCGVGSGS